MTGVALFVIGFGVIGLNLMITPAAERSPFAGEAGIGARPRVQ